MTEKTTSNNYELAKVEEFLPEEIAWDDIKENVKDLDLTCPRIRFSSSDATFALSEDEDSEAVKTFTGVILWWTRQNTYWSGPYESGNTLPPDCFSLDGKTGSKFGNCGQCQFNQFGSAATGKGKACRNQIKLYIQLERKAIPMTFFLSPKNLAAFNKAFLIDVTQKGLSYWKVKAKFTAYKKSRTENYGRVKIEIAGLFKGDELTKLTEIRNFWLQPIQQEHFASSVFAQDDEGARRLPVTTGEEDEANEDTQEVVQTKKESVKETTKTVRTVTPKKPSKEEVSYDDNEEDDPPF